MRYDIESLTELLDVQTILDALNIEKNWKGSRLFIRCPEHVKNTGHLEKEIDNCTISNRGYYCYSCHARGSIYSLIENTQNVGFIQAVEMAANIMGIDIGQYCNDADDSELPIFPLSREELELLGLNMSVTTECPKMNIPYRDKNNHSLLDDVSTYEYNKRYDFYFPSYVYGKTDRVSLMDLYNEDMETFWEIIRGKITEMLLYSCVVIDSQILKVVFKEPKISYDIECGIRKNIEKLNELAQKCGIAQQNPTTPKRIRSRFNTDSLL